MIDEAPEARILAELRPRTSRRVAAAVCLGGLATLFGSVAVAQAPREPGNALLFAAFAGLATYALVRFWRSSALTLTLTESELKDSEGRRLARMEDVASVVRGAFAFKPAHGFVLVLKHPGTFCWAPGVWWRVGRRVGVGGTAASAEARFMAEMINQIVARRDG